MSSFLKEIQELIRRGDAFIRKNGPNRFPAEAAKLLSETELQRSFDFNLLSEFTFSKSFPAEQNFAAFEFSDLPFTLGRGKHCFLDLYVWRRRGTVIHNHHFRGAFQCLLGKNSDLEYLFKREKKLGKFHSVGKLSLKHERMIGPGDVSTIGLLDRYIHQNHHHDEITVNVCFRTPDVPEKWISNYLVGGFEFTNHPVHLNRVERIFRMLDYSEFRPETFVLTLDDKLGFLAKSYRSDRPLVKKFREQLAREVRTELGIDLDQMISQHEKHFEKLMESYD